MILHNTSQKISQVPPKLYKMKFQDISRTLEFQDISRIFQDNDPGQWWFSRTFQDAWTPWLTQRLLMSSVDKNSRFNENFIFRRGFRRAAADRMLTHFTGFKTNINFFEVKLYKSHNFITVSNFTVYVISMSNGHYSWFRVINSIIINIFVEGTLYTKICIIRGDRNL